METIRAINNMAKAESAGLDGERTPGGAALRKQADKINVAANKAIILSNANGLNPDDDRATQIRLAAAIDRQITDRTSERLDSASVTRSIMNDLYMQEAAARRLVLAGDKDPLAHLSSPESARENDRSFEILARNGISANVIMKTASREDIAAIASGRYDKIESEHTRFAVGTVLGHSDRQMATPTMRVPTDRSTQVSSETRRFPAAGLGAGPRPNPVTFGRRTGVER